jgi:short-subunit dehydrogenase
MKKVLVVGATGATGKYVVNFLLNKGHNVVAVARSEETLMSLLLAQTKDDYSRNLTVKELSISLCSPFEIQGLTEGCDAVVRYVEALRLVIFVPCKNNHFEIVRVWRIFC